MALLQLPQQSSDGGSDTNGGGGGGAVGSHLDYGDDPYLYLKMVQGAKHPDSSGLPRKVREMHQQFAGTGGGGRDRAARRRAPGAGSRVEL